MATSQNEAPCSVRVPEVQPPPRQFFFFFFARSGPCQHCGTIKVVLLLFVQENMQVDEPALSCALTMLSVPGENIFEPGPGT